ncbi:hypothetical protein LTR56_027989 [Elasticomyces elasticus]|nr:hypothetical protein LTR56_027989 [Elasticomyces elasticus]
MSYRFTDLLLLGKTLVPGDTNSDDREGHRKMAQLGDSLMGTVILSDGLERGLSRSESRCQTLYGVNGTTVEEMQNACSDICSKQFCGRIARVLRLHEWIKPSERQTHIGIQPTTLKNAVAALIGAVWLDSHDYKAVLGVMISIGLLNHAQYYDELQDTVLMDMSSARSFDDVEACNEIGSGENDHINNDYWSLLPEAVRNLEDPFLVQSMCDLSPMVDLASTMASTSPEGTPAITLSPSPNSLTGSEGQGHQAPLAVSASCGGCNPPAMPGPGVKDFVPQAQQRRGEEKSSKTIRRSDGRVTKRNTTRGLARGQGRPRADSADRILEAYVSHER